MGGDNYRAFAGFFRDTSVWQKAEIWEQRDELPTHTGENGHGPITPAQTEHITGICEAKGLDVKELILTATKGESDNIGTLTKAEASEIIETAKTY